MKNQQQPKAVFYARYSSEMTKEQEKWHTKHLKALKHIEKEQSNGTSRCK